MAQGPPCCSVKCLNLNTAGALWLLIVLLLLLALLLGVLLVLKEAAAVPTEC